MQQCDICTVEIEERSGYLLTTRQVVTNPAYWSFAFSHQWSYVETMPNASAVKGAVVERMAGETAPWIVCDKCAELLGQATAETRQYAERWWAGGRCLDLPGAGPVPVSEVRATDTSTDVVASGVPQPSQVYVVGRGFLPSEADVVQAAHALCAMYKGVLVPNHFRGVVINTSAENGTREDLALAVRGESH